jgi:hypothetical protein
MLGNPLDRVVFRSEALHYFGFTIGPKNIDPPATSGIFPSRKGWYLLEHPLMYALMVARFKAAILPQSTSPLSAGLVTGLG